MIAPHGMLDPWSLNQRRWLKALALTFGWRNALNGAGFLHLLNEDEATLIVDLGLRSPIEVIPNGVFPDHFEALPDVSAFHSGHPKLSGRPYVLFLSRLHVKKGLDYLADAFHSVATLTPDHDLVVAGPDGGARREFTERVASLGLSDRVHLVGPIYGREKYAALRGATCFCLPSRQEGFSMAITEAMACGTPVVISENCHFPEVADVGAGAVVALNAQSVAQAILRFINSPEERERAGGAARDLVFSRFTWPKIASLTVAAYARILNGTDTVPCERRSNQALSVRERVAGVSGRGQDILR